jgi:hypothetical protein
VYDLTNRTSVAIVVECSRHDMVVMRISDS